MRAWFLPGTMLVLSLLSVLLLKSVAPSLAATQFIFFCLGFALFFFVSKLPFSLLLQWRWVAYVALIILLLIPLALGTTTRGIAGWIDIGGIFSIQPSQLAIPVITLVLAHLLTTQSPTKLKTLISFMVIAAIPGVLILIEPDLGTTVIYALALMSLLFLSPVPMKYLLTIAGLGVIAAVIGWAVVLKPYQKQRITSFIAPTSSANKDASYNARQALIAVGSGEVMGRGLGQGIQSHLRFLPERQTDFIFASLAEELGFIGSFLVICLYFGMAFFCLRLAWRSENQAERYFCIAATATLLFQSTVNIGMNMGMMPITGITLPLLSYGGSSILSTCILLGIVQGFTYRQPPKSHLHLT